MSSPYYGEFHDWDYDKIPEGPEWNLFMQFGNKPGPLKTHYTGVFLRETLIYFLQHIHQMANRWQGRLQILKRTYGIIPNDEMREHFWSDYTHLMDNECCALNHLSSILEYACAEINKVHEANNSAVGHLNLQRRSVYLLFLCLDALADTRLMNNNDVINDRRKSFANFNPMTRKAMGYASGLDRTKPPRKGYMCSVRVNSDDQFDSNCDGQKMRTKLPEHFMDLIDALYGKNFDLPIGLFRALLSRYTMFLALLVWNPLMYDTHFRYNFRDPELIFDLGDRDVQALDPEELNSDIENYSLHEDMKKKPDYQVVNVVPRCWIGEDDGVSDHDCLENNRPCDWAAFSQMNIYDAALDTQNLPVAVQPYFARMMLYWN